MFQRIALLSVMLVILGGFVLPALFSAKDSSAVFAGIIIVIMPVYLIAKWHDDKRKNLDSLTKGKKQ